jgi:hypothetical protein
MLTLVIYFPNELSTKMIIKALLFIASASIAHSTTFDFCKIQSPNGKLTENGITMQVTTISTPDVQMHTKAGKGSKKNKVAKDLTAFNWILGAKDPKSSAKGNSDILLTNFVAAQLTFSGAKAVKVDSFIIRDIDFGLGSADTVWVVGSCGSESVPVIYEPGSSLRMIKWAGTSAYCPIKGTDAGEPKEPESQLSVKFSKPVDSITVFLNNSVSSGAAGGEHGVDLADIQVTAVSDTP